MTHPDIPSDPTVGLMPTAEESKAYDFAEAAMAAAATPAGRIAVVEQLHREGKITTEQARLLLDPPPLAPDEIATAEQAATDAEQRYQARERELREAAQASEPWPEPKRERTIANFIPRFEKVSLPAAATAPNAFDPGAIAEIEAANEAAITAFRSGPPTPEDRIIGLAQEIHAAGATSDRAASAPIRQPLTIAGTFRVYFNRHQAAPLVWCVATDRIELAVAEVIITSAYGARTVYAPKAEPDHEDGKPSAWVEVDGVLRIDPSSSTARIG